MVLDSRVGALDRTLGFLFGLGRGLVIVVVAFMFFSWLIPDRSQPEWVRSAKSRIVLDRYGPMADVLCCRKTRKTPILKRLKPSRGHRDARKCCTGSA